MHRLLVMLFEVCVCTNTSGVWCGVWSVLWAALLKESCMVELSGLAVCIDSTPFHAAVLLLFCPHNNNNNYDLCRNHHTTPNCLWPADFHRHFGLALTRCATLLPTNHHMHVLLLLHEGEGEAISPAGAASFITRNSIAGYQY